MDKNEREKTIYELLNSNNFYDFKVIETLIQICYEKKNVELIYELFWQVNEKMLNPNVNNIKDKYTLKYIIKNSSSYPGNIDEMSYQELIECLNDKIIRYCESIMRIIILITHDLLNELKDNQLLKQIIATLSQSKNRNCRLYCCNIIDDFHIFLNDSDKRVQKVADIRNSFEKVWESYSNDEKAAINNLIQALGNNKIITFDGCVRFDKEDKFLAQLSDSKYKPISEWFPFDKDIAFNIKDKRIYASRIYNLIREGKIKYFIDSNESRYTRVNKESEKAKTLKRSF